MTTKWISVDRELPALGTPVLVVWDGIVQHMIYVKCDGGWQPCNEDYNDAPDSTFTHWMPLPNPPEVK